MWPLLFLIAPLMAAESYPAVHYYRSSNFDRQLPLSTNASSKISSSRAVLWNTTFQNFDSPRDVHVARLDVFYESGDALKIRLGGNDGVLRLPEGAGYLFINEGTLTVRDTVAGGAEKTATAEDPVWLSKGSCVSLEVATASRQQDSNNITVLIVSSGAIDPTLRGAALSSTDCVRSTIEVGTEDLHNNPVDYVHSGSCSNPLSGPGGAADFDDLDAPIRPLQAHYHTRSAIYYTTRGVSSYNDPGERPLTSGELRFVTAGHYYGPETMWGGGVRGNYVLSLHEADPAARSTAPSDPPIWFRPCPFACLDKEGEGDLMRCVVKKE